MVFAKHKIIDRKYNQTSYINLNEDTCSIFIGTNDTLFGYGGGNCKWQNNFFELVPFSPGFENIKHVEKVDNASNDNYDDAVNFYNINVRDALLNALIIRCFVDKDCKQDAVNQRLHDHVGDEMAAGLRPEAVQGNVSEGDLEQDAAEQQHGVECDGLGQAIREPLLLEH